MTRALLSLGFLLAVFPPACGFAAAPAPLYDAPAPTARATPPIRWAHSCAAGTPTDGRLVHGVLLPAEGRTFFTWDFPLRRSPNRAWRRWGTDRLVRTTLRVLDGYSAAHPEAPRVTIGDLSRPRGGPFGPEYGFPGHASHQNGLDIDIYYPRRDRRERAAVVVTQVDRRLSQDLVNRFVSIGAERVYVGRRVGLRGPRGVVVPLWRYHENHMHVRLRPGGAACRR